MRILSRLRELAVRALRPWPNPRPNPEGSARRKKVRPPLVLGPWRRLGPLSALSAVVWAAAVVFGAPFFLDLVEGPTADLVHRTLSDREPSGRVWIVDLNGSAPHGTSPTPHSTDPRESWKRILDVSRQDGVRLLVNLDFSHSDAVAKARQHLPDGSLPTVFTPSRLVPDPRRERSPTLETPAAPGASHLEDPFRNPVLHLVPDRDGVWRRAAPSIPLGEYGRIPTLAAVLASDLPPPDSTGHWELVPCGPAGIFPRVPLESLLDREFGSSPPWRGGVLVVSPGFASGPRFRNALGDELGVAEAVAQLAEALETGAVYRAVPPWCIGASLFLLFLLGVHFALAFAPRRGLLALILLGLSLEGGLVLSRESLHWDLPLVPLLPTLAVAYAWGLGRRHRLLVKRLTFAVMNAGRRQLLEPLVSEDLELKLSLERLLEILDVEVVAVIRRGPRNSIDVVDIANHFEPESLEPWLAELPPNLLKPRRRGEPPPLFHSRLPGDIGLIVAPLTTVDGEELFLLIQAHEFAEVWWRERRELVGRLAVSLALQVGARPHGQVTSLESEGLSLEGTLDSLNDLLRRTQLDRSMLLQLERRASAGTLVTDLLGRRLVKNAVFDEFLSLLAIPSDASLAEVLAHVTSHHSESVWRRVQQVISQGVSWDYLQVTHEPELRIFLLRLEVVDLRGSVQQEGHVEALRLSVTDLTSLGRDDPHRIARALGLAAEEDPQSEETELT